MATALVVSGCTADDDPTPDAAGGPVYPASQVDPLIAALPSESLAAPPAMRLADGLVPPTSTWFAGLVFGETAQPVFPFPISFQLTASGVAAGLPRPVASPTSVVAPAVVGLTLDLGAEEALVSSYDKVAVTIEHRAGGTVLGRTTVAQGSPLVSYTAETDQTDTLGAPVVPTGDGRGTVDVGGSSWGVVVTGGGLDGTSVDLDAGGSVVLVALPDGTTPSQVGTVLDAAASPLTGVRTTFGASGGAAGSSTALDYVTAAAADTLIVPAPHQGETGGGTATGLGYETIMGTVPLTIGSRLSFDAPTVTASSELDLDGLSADERDALGRQLRADVASTGEFPADTYFGGKAIYRATMLWQLAVQLGDDESADTVKERVVDQLDLWTDPDGCTIRAQQCFVYDPTVKGLVGRASSFGSELFNDHHFHYGYFLYAAGVLGAHDPELAERWAPVMDLVAADIGSGSESGAFPDQRAFDPYWSHSWASGYSPFADGNNQESSSEAVGASAGLSLWATATGDDALAAQATWMLSAEAASALAYFVAPDLSDPVFDGYEHRIVSLNWGAKRDYATWFSAEPSAIAGIQLIPLDPTSVSYLSSDAAGGAEQIAAVVAESGVADGGAAAPLGDYVLMYSALAGPSEATEALSALADLPEAGIDDGNSRAYAMAYILSAGSSTAEARGDG